jgi:hypothetical protein
MDSGCGLRLRLQRGLRSGILAGVRALCRAVSHPPRGLRPWWEALTGDPAVVAHRGEIRQASGAAHLSLLRVADIIVWMTHRPSGDIGEQ